VTLLLVSIACWMNLCVDLWCFEQLQNRLHALLGKAKNDRKLLKTLVGAPRLELGTSCV